LREVPMGGSEVSTGVVKCSGVKLEWEAESASVVKCSWVKFKWEEVK